MVMMIIAASFFLAWLSFASATHGAQIDSTSVNWQFEWERTIKAAEQEGEFSYYSLGEIGFLSEFEKKFPRLKEKVVQGKGNELLVRIMSERRAGKYFADVARIGKFPRASMARPLSML